MNKGLMVEFHLRNRCVVKYPLDEIIQKFVPEKFGKNCKNYKVVFVGD